MKTEILKALHAILKERLPQYVVGVVSTPTTEHVIVSFRPKRESRYRSMSVIVTVLNDSVRCLPSRIPTGANPFECNLAYTACLSDPRSLDDIHRKVLEILVCNRRLQRRKRKRFLRSQRRKWLEEL